MQHAFVKAVNSHYQLIIVTDVLFRMCDLVALTDLDTTNFYKKFLKEE